MNKRFRLNHNILYTAFTEFGTTDNQAFHPATNAGEIDMYFVDREKPVSKQPLLGKTEKTLMADDDMVKDQDVKVSRGLSDLYGQFTICMAWA